VPADRCDAEGAVSATKSKWGGGGGEGGEV